MLFFNESACEYLFYNLLVFHCLFRGVCLRCKYLFSGISLIYLTDVVFMRFCRIVKAQVLVRGGAANNGRFFDTRVSSP